MKVSELEVEVAKAGATPKSQRKADLIEALLAAEIG